ncbi:hypothetical protein ATK23_1441 [Glutamicibacter mysorens]|uniref:Uncharacterized protein n=1 Tax=Glutamicibacter mysorens TaxID=257984 RepID=A0ABX4MYX1_9MICC|nr:hypothetical protein ATK23_1441 [Glutamicibacter mysorens]
MHKATQGIVRSVFYSTVFIIMVTVPQAIAQAVGAPVAY